MDLDAAKFATELAKIVVKEVYGDVFSPAAKEVGSFLQDTAKALRRALPNIQYLAVDQDRYRRFIEASIERVPHHRRVAAAEQLLGPIIEGIRYEPEGSMSDEAFSELLSRAFDRERTSQAHPAFPGMIRALSDDEILLLRRLKRTGQDGFCIALGHQLGGVLLSADPELYRSNFSDLSHPILVRTYANHLEALGLIMNLIATDANEGFDRVGEAIALEYPVRLSDLGWLFVSAVFGHESELP